MTKADLVSEMAKSAGIDKTTVDNVIEEGHENKSTA